MTIKQFVEIDAFENVHGFVKAEALPERTGFVYEEVNPPEPHFPTRPFSKAILRRSNGVSYWYDPRSLAEKSADARAARDARFALSDREAIKAFRQGLPMPPAWAIYAQALAEVPEQAGFPDLIEWPIAPV